MQTQLFMLRTCKVNSVSFGTLAKFCAALGCSPGELIDYDFSSADLQGNDED